MKQIITLLSLSFFCTFCVSVFAETLYCPPVYCSGTTQDTCHIPMGTPFPDIFGSSCMTVKQGIHQPATVLGSFIPGNRAVRCEYDFPFYAGVETLSSQSSLEADISVSSEWKKRGWQDKVYECTWKASNSCPLLAPSL